MERKEFLEMCQKVSMLQKGVCGIVENIPPEMVLNYGAMCFYPVGHKLSFKNGKPQHTAILHSLKANSIIECDLSKIKGD